MPCRTPLSSTPGQSYLPTILKVQLKPLTFVEQMSGFCLGSIATTKSIEAKRAQPRTAEELPLRKITLEKTSCLWMLYTWKRTDRLEYEFKLRKASRKGTETSDTVANSKNQCFFKKTKLVHNISSSMNLVSPTASTTYFVFGGCSIIFLCCTTRNREVMSSTALSALYWASN